MAQFFPETYGAVGNGTTDDTAAFNSLNAALATAGGGEVILEGTYFIPNGWTLPSNRLLIDGRGRGAIRARLTVSSSAALYMTGRSNITVRDIAVTLPLTNTRNGGFAVLFEQGSDIQIRGVRTTGGRAGIWFVQCARVHVEGCNVLTPKADGIHFGHGSTDCRAIGNVVTDAGDDSYATSYYSGFGKSRRIIFANNISQGGRWGCGVAVHGADDVEIVGNYLNECALAGIQVAEWETSGPSTNIKIVGNRITKPCQVNYQPETYWYGTGTDPQVTAPSFLCGISIASGTEVEVTGNTISGVPTGVSNSPKNGLFITKANHLSVTGNTFRGVSGYGIAYVGNQLGNAVIADNIFDVVNLTPIALVGSAYTGTVSIVGNKSQNVAFSAPFAQVEATGFGSTRLVVSGNVNADGRGVVIGGSNVVNTANVF